MLRKNTFQIFAVPDGIQLTVLLAGFVAAGSPYVSNADFGFVKIPDLSGLPSLGIYGLIAIALFLGCYLPIWPDSSNKLVEENEELKSQLAETLSASGVTTNTVMMGGAINQVSPDISNKIDDLIERMERISVTEVRNENPEWHLELAKGHMARKRWRKAAKHFDVYVLAKPDDYYSQLSRGAAYANLRDGYDTNLKALRAYNEAIAFADNSPDKWLNARLFMYRGAMLKRLNRLSESEADLLIGKARAVTEYEKNDADYNLACVYAIKKERLKLFETVKRLEGKDRELSGIRSHLDDYFSNFSNDKEFMSLIGNT
ncbi:MAG: hypothetical protein AAF903_06145 [Pseudomonadota bacterium]